MGGIRDVLDSVIATILSATIPPGIWPNMVNEAHSINAYNKLPTRLPMKTQVQLRNTSRQPLAPSI